MAESRLVCPKEEFTWRLRARLPLDVCFSFTTEQLDALRSAFGSRFERQHALDMRGRIYLPWSKYYVVLQFGRDRRSDAGKPAPVRTIVDSITCGLALGGCLVGLTWLLSCAF